jgi:hypothetical protein
MDLPVNMLVVTITFMRMLRVNFSGMTMFSSPVTSSG